jgi:hypothetical protein
MSKIDTLFDTHGDDRESLVREIIEECMFAILIASDTKFNPMTAKNIVLEHFELEKENDDFDL